MYDPGTAEKWKSDIAFASQNYIKAYGTLHGPVRVFLNFYLPRNKSDYSMSKKEMVRKLKPSAPKYHIKKPDPDNLAKAVLDALTNLGAWGDDKQVVQLWINKEYAADQNGMGCEISITEMY